MATVHAGGERRHSDSSDTITVRVRLFAALRRFLPPGVDGPLERALRPGATVADLLHAIGIPDDTDATVAIDGELAERRDTLHDGADVMVLSPMEGG
jgi:sulfur carrier protein ThiS